MGRRFERIMAKIEGGKDARGAEVSAAFLQAWVDAVKKGEYGDRFSSEDIAQTEETILVEKAVQKFLKASGNASQN